MKMSESLLAELWHVLVSPPFFGSLPCCVLHFFARQNKIASGGGSLSLQKLINHGWPTSGAGAARVCDVSGQEQQ